MKILYIRIVLALVALLFFGSYLFLNRGIDPHQFMVKNILFLLTSLGAVVGGFFVARVYGLTSDHGKAFLYITSGIACLFIGEVIWVVFESILKTKPFPSIADLFYLASYPLLLVGFFKELRLYNFEVKLATKPLLQIIAFIASLIVLYFSIFLAYDSQVTLLENGIAIAYGVGDLILIVSLLYVLALALNFRSGKMFSGWLYMFAGMILTLIADILFAMYQDQFEAGMWFARQIDLLWGGGYLLMAFGLFEIGFFMKNNQEWLAKLKEKVVVK